MVALGRVTWIVLTSRFRRSVGRGCSDHGFDIESTQGGPTAGGPCVGPIALAERGRPIGRGTPTPWRRRRDHARSVPSFADVDGPRRGRALHERRPGPGAGPEAAFDGSEWEAVPERFRPPGRGPSQGVRPRPSQDRRRAETSRVAPAILCAVARRRPATKKPQAIHPGHRGRWKRRSREVPIRRPCSVAWPGSTSPSVGPSAKRRLSGSPDGSLTRTPATSTRSNSSSDITGTTRPPPRPC